MASRELTKIAAAEIARQARVGVQEIRGVDDTELSRIAEKVTEQDPWWLSRRVHASAAAVLVLILSVFGVSWEQSQVVEVLGALAALAAAVLPLISKVSDIRTVRRKPWRS